MIQEVQSSPDNLQVRKVDLSRLKLEFHQVERERVHLRDLRIPKVELQTFDSSTPITFLRLSLRSESRIRKVARVVAANSDSVIGRDRFKHHLAHSFCFRRLSFVLFARFIFSSRPLR